MEIAYLEIYNEQLMDLLDSTTGHKIQEDPTWGADIKTIQKVQVSSFSEAIQLLEKG